MTPSSSPHRLPELFGVGRRTLWIALAAVVLVVGGAVWLSFRLAPPTTIVLGGGPAGSPYDKIAQKYRQILARDGITVKVVATAGAVDNLRRLADPKGKIDAAFVQDGLAGGAEYPQLVSLGGVAYQPLRVYYRNVQGSAPMPLLSGLAGKRVAVGPDGSGTAVLARALLQLNGIEGTDGGQDRTALLPLDADAAAQGLLGGSVDALFLMGDSASTDVLRALARDPSVRLYDFVQADAYVRRLHSLNKLTLPRGSTDPGRDLPDHDVSLVGPTVELVARASLHPAIVDLLLDCERQVHGGAGTFQHQGEFPALVEHDFALSDEALRYAKSGKTFLYRDLPFWLANVVNRLLLVGIPSLLVLLPAIRIVPALYRWRVRLRLYRWYGELIAIEGDARRAGPGLDEARRAGLRERLDAVERKVNGYRAPASSADQVYALRGYIHFVRERLAA